MAAGSTYTPIATVSTSAASYTFSSIPSTYTDLVLIGSLRSDKTTANSDTLFVQYNGNTGSNYSTTRLQGNGSSATSATQSSQSQIALPEISSNGDTSGIFTPVIHNVINYSNSSTYKTSISRTNAVSVFVMAIVGLWRGTAAINSITIYPAGGNFASGSTLTLYGIAAA
jgi:hypothetical protein